MAAGVVSVITRNRSSKAGRRNYAGDDAENVTKNLFAVLRGIPRKKCKGDFVYASEPKETQTPDPANLPC